MYDYIIKNGMIADGTGKETHIADIGITGEKIAFIGHIYEDESNGKIIDASNLIVAPGFINMHSHGDQTLFLYPRGEGTVKQGITTCYCGNCGATPGPIDKMWVRKFWEYDAWDEVDPYIENANTILPTEKVVPIIEQRYNTKIDWRSIGEYLNKLESMGISYNYIPNIGHGDIRAQVLGAENRKPTPKEMEEMKKYLVDALEAGVYGMTTGMDYEPGKYADVDEICELVSIVKEYGGIYTTHWRNRGKDSETRTKGLMEAFEVAKRTGVKLHVNHLSDLFYNTEMISNENASIRAGKTLRYIDNVVKEGVDLIFDVIPNTSGGFEYIPYLTGYFMPFIRISGCVDNFINNLQKHDFINILKEWIQCGKGGLINPKVYPNWAKWLLIVGSQTEEYIGKSIEDLYDFNYDSDCTDTVLRLLKEEPLIRTKLVRADAEVVKEFLSHDKSLVGTDTFNFDGYGTFGRGKKVPDILVHPNTFSGMINYILNYSVGSIEEAISKITGKPAEWLMLDKRGFIKEGYFADITIIDKNVLSTNENYMEPCQYPSGIRHVFVNGELVVNNGEHTEKRPGKILRRYNWSK